MLETPLLTTDSTGETMSLMTILNSLLYEAGSYYWRIHIQNFNFYGYNMLNIFCVAEKIVGAFSSCCKEIRLSEQRIVVFFVYW